MMQSTPRFFVLLVLSIGLVACAKSDDSDDMGASPSTTGGGSETDTDTDTGSASNGGTGDETTTGEGTSGGTTDTGTTDNEGGTAEVCPLGRPAEGTACESTAPVCTYDDLECTCESGLWSCEEPVHPGCPTTLPAQDSTCDLPEATECDFLEHECECLEGLWVCESENDGGVEAGVDGGLDGGATSDASGPACPQGRPAEGTTCEASDLMCTYDTTECECPDGMWSCVEPVDRGCPDAPPLHGDPCAGFADCDFLEVECECFGSSWNCKPND